MSEPASDRFETIAFVYSPSDLALLLSLFEHADIHVQSIGRGHASVDWSLMTALGGIRLRVREADGDEARALLAGLDPVPYRGRLLTGFWPVDLLVFAAIIYIFGVGSPPRQIPAFVPGAAAARGDA